MKFATLLLTITLILGYLFGEEEYDRLSHIQTISESPAFANATFEKIDQAKGKKSISYFVKYRYEVNGQTYHVSTTPTDQQGALAYVAQQNMQVAYSTRDPSVGILKRYYDLRNPNDSLAKALTVTTLLAIGLALPIAVFFAWRLGWLKKNTNKGATERTGQR